MRLAPDLSPFGSDLPDLEDLLPEEIRYLCDVCAQLHAMGICTVKDLRQRELAFFDRDELGEDPEED